MFSNVNLYKIVQLIILLLYASLLSAQNSEYEISAEQFLKEGNTNKAVENYGKAGYYYWNKGKHQQAIDNFKKALGFNLQLNNPTASIILQNNLGLIYSDIEDYNNALSCFQKVYDLEKGGNQKTDIASCLINIATTYQALGNYDLSINSANEAIKVAEEINDLKILRKCYGTIAETYEKKGNSEKAFAYYEKFSIIDKRIKKTEFEEIKNNAEDQVNKANIEKKLKENELHNTTDILKRTADSLEMSEKVTKEQRMEIDLRNSQLLTKEAQLKYEQYIRKSLLWGVIGVSIFLLLLSYMFLLKIQDNNLLKQKNDKIEIQTKEILIQNEKLDKQNKNITASINYAKTIQQAILPSKQMMDKYFESFVIYRPKDIVSGDFYWFTTVEQTGKKDLLFLAVADCTGHGVPGAFMSMIGSRLLNEIVNENNILQPSEILCQLNQKLRSALNQENNKNNDGIDIGICQIQNENFNERKIIFAGAKRPLVYYSKNENSMSVVEGDHKSIGGCSEVKSSIHFKDNEVIIRKGDMFYISSDGIIDQNGPDKKRFGTPRLLDNLKMLANYTPDEQKKKLESVMNEFLNNQEQRDDITIIGIKLI